MLSYSSVFLRMLSHFFVLVMFLLQSRWSQRLLIVVLLLVGLGYCLPDPSFGQVPGCLRERVGRSPGAQVNPATLSLLQPTSNLQTFRQSWMAYRQHFIQEDGRVIDRETDDRSTSEGQAYAMLRAVMIDDPDAFVRTLNWAENNFTRKDQNGDRIDHLWAWKWGRTNQGEWTILDANFASDADIDAITALILASRRWNCSEYLSLARLKLKDLWDHSTVTAPDGTRYLLPGPAHAFRPEPNTIILNPSYMAPYAFRLFAQVNPRRDWMSLVESSYQVLEGSTAVSSAHLPSDWISLNLETKEFRPLSSSSQIRSQYGFDAYRVWWRVSLDATWFQAPRAKDYLRQNLEHLQQRWQTQQAIPAQISLAGEALVDYEATSQYAMLYSAFRLIDPAIAEQIYQQKLMSSYQNGFWDNNSAYYTQNLVWFGLLPPSPPRLLEVEASHSR